MEAASLNIDHPEWRISVNIPLDLIGGEYNNHSKVKRRAILNADKWYTGNGVENIDYIPITIYDPSLFIDIFRNSHKL